MPLRTAGNFRHRGTAVLNGSGSTNAGVRDTMADAGNCWRSVIPHTSLWRSRTASVMSFSQASDGTALFQERGSACVLSQRQQCHVSSHTSLWCGNKRATRLRERVSQMGQKSQQNPETGQTRTQTGHQNGSKKNPKTGQKRS